MEEHEVSDRERAEAAAVAKADQELADWTFDAACLAAFYNVLIEQGVPKRLSCMLTHNAQVNYYSTATDDDDADD